MNPRIALALALLAAFALGALLVVASERDDHASGEGDRGSRGFEGARMPAGLRAPELGLRNQDGERVSMRKLRGRPVIVTFLYTTCEETCPGQAQQVKGGLDQLGHDVPALAIAVDPRNDTPEKARRFLFDQGLSDRMDFILGSVGELEPVWRGYAIQPQTNEAEHQARIVLVDKRGFQRIGFPLAQATPERIAHDLRLLERERGPAERAR